MASSVPEPAGIDDGLIGQLERGRRQYLALVEPVRPELHRYCARLTGSSSTARTSCRRRSTRALLPPSQPTRCRRCARSFSYRHNRAIAYFLLEKDDRRHGEPLDTVVPTPTTESAGLDPDETGRRGTTKRCATRSRAISSSCRRCSGARLRASEGRPRLLARGNRCAPRWGRERARGQGSATPRQKDAARFGRPDVAELSPSRGLAGPRLRSRRYAEPLQRA